MRLILPLVVLLSSLSACSPAPTPTEDRPPLEQDAGALVADAGSPVVVEPIDAGLSPDAGAPVDAGCQCLASETCLQGRCVADVTAPRVTVTARAGATAATLHVSGTASDGESGLASVELRVNGATPVTATLVNGSYDAQLPVPPGRAEFTVEATARDRANNVATARAVSDTAAPELTLSPSQPGACTSTGCTGAVIDASTNAFTLTATVTEGLALAAQNPVQVRVLDGTTELVGWTNLTRQATGDWSWTWSPLPALDFTRLTFEVAATDAANNRGLARLNALLDRVRPSLLVTPSLDAACTATACTGTVLNLASSALELSGVAATDATVRVSVLDGATAVVPAQAVTTSNGSWSFSWSNLPSVDGRFYTVVVTATDALLNTTTRQLTVLVDRALPGLVVNSPVPSQLVGAAKVNVSASAIDGSGVAGVEVATSLQAPSVAASRDATGDFVAQLDVPLVDAVEQVLTVRATDLAGNVRAVTARYLADRVAPVLAVNGRDYDCSGPDGCIGSVLNAATSQFPFSGSVTDGSAITLERALFGPAGAVSSSTTPTTGGSWSWSWSNPPQGVNGAAYELRVVARDAAGNASPQVTRRVWVDTVAPTVSVPVAGQRNVALDATVAVFSEPMNMASVVSATSTTPVTNQATFGSSDGRLLKVVGTPLYGYTPYTLTLAPAQDKAGNATPPTTATFLTTVATFPNHHVFLWTSSWQARAPRIVVDQDGRFTIAVTVASQLRLIRDQGNGDQAAPTGFGNTADFEVPVELALTRQQRGADQRLSVEFQLGTIFTSGGVSSLSRITFPDNAALTRQTVGVTAATSLATATRVRPSFELMPYYDLLTRRVQTYGVVAGPNNGATAVSWWTESQGNWSAGTSFALSSLQSFEGRASVEATSVLGQSRVRFWDFNGASLVATDSFIRSATAQPARKSATPTGTVAASSSYVAWTKDAELTVACSAAPFASTPVWRSTPMPTRASRSTGTPLVSAMSATRFVVAGEYGGEVLVYSTSLSDCSAPPAVTLVGRIPNAREPGVTIDEHGRIWVAWLSPDGAVGLSSF